jgi:hypothetical protein
MTEQVNNLSDKAIVSKIDDGIKSINELRSALSVLAMVSELNKSFMVIDRQARTAVIQLR